MFKDLFANFDFSPFRLHVDSGFQGIAKQVQSEQIFIPHKARKKTPLTQEQKDENTALSRLRVSVENAIAKIKSFFILRIENRMRKKAKLDDAMELCVALANFKTKSALNVRS